MDSHNNSDNVDSSLADADPETPSLHPVQVLTNVEEPGIHMEQKK
jgi:hypothetical protein